MTDDESLDLSHGYSAGNYASAYVSEDFDTAMEAKLEEKEEESDVDEYVMSDAYRAGFVLGFWSSFEDHEVSEEHMDELQEAVAQWGEKAESNGIAGRYEKGRHE